MDLSIIANLNDVPAVQSFLKKQSISQNTNSISPLVDAQTAANKLMAMKQRIPMVFEYYKSKDDPPVSVEMYINPNRLSIQTQKLKTKQVTRGGIFYHHWGDDHWSMQLSGTVGLAGMKGIEQLEKIYHYSGALLHYTDIGIEKVHDSKANFNYETINFNPSFNSNAINGLNHIMSDYNIQETTIESIKQHYIEMLSTPLNSELRNPNLTLNSNAKIMEIVIALIKNYQNVIKLAKNSGSYSDMYVFLSNYISQNQQKNRYVSFDAAYREAQKRVRIDFPNLNSDIQLQIAYDITAAVFLDNGPETDMIYMTKDSSGDQNLINQLNNISSGYISKYNNTKLVSNSINATHNNLGKQMAEALNDYIKDVQSFNNRMKINRNNISSQAWGDINDELTDEWRPRQVFIYFEDRVYIGHFDSFQYQRVAENPLIQYDMRFTVTRQIIVSDKNS